VAVLDMNEEPDGDLAEKFGSSVKQWICDVADTESIAAAVKAITKWTHETGRPLGGIVSAAGVGNPELVRRKGHRKLSCADGP
jgi:3-hydroxyacyl-CoA dehydrogenase / 3-hydroxy-2-methylbutyryl-CoA dehydrogenase